MFHTVFFWLKPDLGSEQIAFFEKELQAVTAISYLESGACGRPAPTAARPVSDHSFSYQLLLRFKSMADHDFYQADCEDHKRFIANCKELWNKVLVYDAEELQVEGTL